MTTPAPAGAISVVINEALVDAPGDDEGFEWVELKNTGSAEVDLTNFYIGWQKSESSTGASQGFPEGTTLAAGGYLLVGGAEVAGADVEVDLDLGQGTGGDGLYLVNPCDRRVDALVYGGSNEDAVPDESGGTATSAPKPGAGESLARCADGVDGQDSDDPAADFVVMAEESVTPGAVNDCPAESTAAGVSVVINEVMVDPEGADTGLEWIELLNTGSEDAHLDLWVIEVFKSDPEDGTEVQLPVGLLVPAGGRVVIGGDSVAFEPDAVLNFSFGNGDGGDAIHLYDFQGALEDAIVYGDSNEDGMLDEHGVATSIAPDPASGVSLARCPDGEDTDASGDDFQACMAEGGTPGEVNDACCGGGGSCDEASAVTLVVNELMPNPDSTDTGNEWVEIYNPGSRNVDASGWRLAWYKSDPASPSGTATLPSGTLIPSRGYLLVGDEFVTGTDVQATLDLGNGTDGDGLHLLDCGGVLEDAVVYGSNNDDLIEDENGVASSIAPNPGSGVSLGRESDGADTNRSGDDFCDSSANTPGAANAGCAP
ncbi:MAG: lamin tail domain-containing protein [Pseudomonadota bacterium]